MARRGGDGYKWNPEFIDDLEVSANMHMGCLGALVFHDRHQTEMSN